MTKFVANVHIPGYLPEGDTPVFDTAADAWAYLADERERGEDSAESWEDGRDGLSDSATRIEEMTTLAKLRMMAEAGFDLVATDGRSVGSVGGPTPGYDGDHDLGLIYEVQAVSEAEAAEIEAMQG